MNHRVTPRMRAATVAALACAKPLAAVDAAAPQKGSAAPAAVTAGPSPIVTWYPEGVHGGSARPPTLRPLSAGETPLARQRAEHLCDAVKRAPSFSPPVDEASRPTAWAVVNEQRRVEQKFVACASNPRNVRRRADAALWGTMGGSHEPLFMDIDRLPNAVRQAEHEVLWQTETHDPVALARRLDAAGGSGDAGTPRQRERVSAPAGAGAPMKAASTRCEHHLPQQREIDGVVLRGALGW